MFRLHREGRVTILLALALALVVAYLLAGLPAPWHLIAQMLPVAFFIFILQFFRHPTRRVEQDDGRTLVAPADGKVVVIEKVLEAEYLKTECLQVSIFMSPLNVHVNWNPVDALVEYYRYHKGKYLVAWHPKSSTENERTTIVYQAGSQRILVRQIAGAVARRIVNYLQEGQQVKRGDEMGFIKFGSRVDILLPADAEILVIVGQKVKGNITPLAKLTRP